MSRQRGKIPTQSKPISRQALRFSVTFKVQTQAPKTHLTFNINHREERKWLCWSHVIIFVQTFIPEKVNTYWRPVAMGKTPSASMRPTENKVLPNNFDFPINQGSYNELTFQKPPRGWALYSKIPMV